MLALIAAWIPTEEKRYRNMNRAEYRIYKEYTEELDAVMGRTLLQRRNLLEDPNLLAEAEKSKMRLVLAGIWPKMGHDDAKGLLARKYKALTLKGLVRGFVDSSDLTTKGRRHFQKKHGGDEYEFLR